jgi:hypothetical protein
MAILSALILAAAAPQAIQAPATAPQPRGVHATALATVEIVRAETSSPVTEKGATMRQVRPQRDGQVLIEFN